MFDWDDNNLRKVAAHQIERAEAEQALLNEPIAIYEQEVEGEPRYVYYGETNAGRLLAVIVTERGHQIRVITAYDLDASQKHDSLERRVQGG
ncbi:MAG: BrnT family toxin [Terriglobales bacterium]|jgi:uncharacterized DUF497 family protein